MRPNPWPLLRRLARQPSGESDPVSDAELLARFARDRDQAAFELLVWRHGPMVLAACQRILRDAHLAEDAFQAAFLILARKAGTVRAGGSVAGWLHRVARRVALRAAKQRKYNEPLATDPPGRPSSTPDEDLRSILDAEIDRLPDRFRLPVVLCYLDGRTTEDAAKLLGVPRGTVLSRLATARQRLSARLTRRGITAPVTLITVAGSGTDLISTEAVAACVSTAVRFASGVAVPGVSVQLAEGVIRMGFRNATAAWVTVMLATAAVGTGIAVTADGPKTEASTARVAASAQPDSPPQAPKPVEKGKAEPDRRKVLAEAIDRLQMEREKLNAQADELQALIARKQREGLNPQVIKAMEAVLTEAELTLFRTEMELLTEKYQRVAQAQREYDEARGKKIDPMQVDAAADREPAVVKLRDSLQESESRLRELSAAAGGDHPSIKRMKDRVAELSDKLTKARVDARAKAAEELISAVTRAAKAKLDDAERSVGSKEHVLKAARQKRDEIVLALEKASDRKPSTDVQRLEAELQTNREMARQLSRLAMELDLKLKGLPVPDSARPTASDDKLDSVLRELTELRAEIRRLGEKK